MDAADAHHEPKARSWLAAAAAAAMRFVDRCFPRTRHAPQEVHVFGDDAVVCVATDVAACAAVTAGGGMFVWGCNDADVLGTKIDAESGVERTPRLLTASASCPASGAVAVSIGGLRGAWLLAAPQHPAHAEALKEAPAKKKQRTA